MRKAAALAVAATLFLSAATALAEVAFDEEMTFGGAGIGRGNFDRPVDVAADRNENIYVVDQGNNRVQVFDRRGNHLREWGGRGFGKGAFDGPAAIAVAPDGDAVYVVDGGNNRIQKFDPSGKYLLEFGRLGSGRGDFKRPSDLALDNKGNLYVVDSGNTRLQKFGPSGNFLAEWGRMAPNRRGNALKDPVSVAFSEEGFGYLYVATADCQVQKFDLDGLLVASFPVHPKGEEAPCGGIRIRIEPRKYTVYIADTESNRVLLLDRAGEPLGDLRGVRTPFRKPSGLFISNAFGEYVLVADTNNNLIQQFRRR